MPYPCHNNVIHSSGDHSRILTPRTNLYSAGPHPVGGQDTDIPPAAPLLGGIWIGGSDAEMWKDRGGGLEVFVDSLLTHN